MPRRTGSQSTPQKVPWRLLLQISGESHTTIGMEVKEKILIGRVDPSSDVQPDLDLTPHGGDTGGVSRRHAQIVQQENALFVEDMDSTNGTRVSGYLLEPHHRYRLRDGDELTLGTLRIVVRFVKSPNAARQGS